MTLLNPTPQRHHVPATIPEMRSLARISHPTMLGRSELLLLVHSALKRCAADRLRILEVTSAVHGEGVTTIARDLAQVVACEVGHPALLITTTSSQTGPDGLEAVVAGEMPLDQAVEADRNVPDLYRARLSTGGCYAGLLFESGDLHRVFSQAQRIAKLIVIDAPPVLSDVTAVALASHAAGVLLVVEAEKTRASLVERARRHIESADGRLCGVVMNKRRQHVPNSNHRPH